MSAMILNRRFLLMSAGAAGLAGCLPSPPPPAKPVYGTFGFDIAGMDKTVANRDEAFERYLMPGKPAYVDRYAADLEQAIGLVKDAGGKTVLAHPWSRGSKRVLTRSRIAALTDVGLDRIEVDHNDHDGEDRAGLAQITRELGLVRTGSSDYHGTGKIGFDLGCNTTSRDQLHRLLG